MLLTTPDAPAGRGRILTANPFAQKFGSNKDLHKPQSQTDIAKLLQSYQVDLVLTIAYGKLIKPELLSTPRYGWLNLHFSLLPRWRGAAPVQRAILAGDKESGVTVFQLDAGLDTGPIFVQSSYKIPARSSAGDVLSDLSVLGSTAVISALRMIEKGISPKNQATDGVTIAAKILKSEARINWNSTTEQVFNVIRAMSPNPLAWTQCQNKRLVVERATPVEGDYGRPGLVSVVNGEVIIATGNGGILIEQVIPEGKRAMLASEWARGARLAGDVCL